MQFQQTPGRLYALDADGTLIAEITHTFVHPRLRGQGIAAQLMEASVAVLRKQGLSVRPVCSYAVQWFAQHPEEARSLLHVHR